MCAGLTTKPRLMTTKNNNEYRSLIPQAPVEVTEQPDGCLLVRNPAELEPYEACLGNYLIKWAAETPECTFLAQRNAAGGWHHLSYQAALADAEQIGAALLKRGLGLERPLMVLSGNSLEFARIMLAATLVGVPVVPVSPAYSLVSKTFEKLRYIHGLIRPGLIYVDDTRAFAGALNALDLEGTEVVAADNEGAPVNASSFASLLTVPVDARVQEAATQVGPDTVAKVLFTSGSTGMPKGVINTHRMLCSNQQAIRQVWPFLESHRPVIVDWLPWNHTFGGCHNFNMILCNGGTLYIDEGKPLPGMIETTVANLREISPTLYFNVPAGYQVLLPFLEADDELCKRFFESLDLILCAAASLPQNICNRLDRLAVKTRGRKIPMLSSWGATETAPLATSTCRPINHSGEIGLPVPGTDIKMVPHDEKYELRVRGPNVTPGYWKQPDQSRKAFDEAGYFLTGDAATFVNAHEPGEGILFGGRIAEEFKLDTGTWVAVGKLRVAVLEACSPILQDAVICGQDRNEVGLLMILNIKGCRSLYPDLDTDISLEQLACHAGLQAKLVELLRLYNQTNPGSSTRIGRALLLTSPLSIDAGEITDKGYINQRGVIKHRSDTVEVLYADAPSVLLI